MPPKKRAAKRRAKKKPQKSPAIFAPQVGGSIVDWAINNNYLPELHFRGFDSKFKAYNFAGPGTKLDKRLDGKMQPKAHSKPINRVDQSAYNHDLGYEAHKDHKTRKILDNVMIEDLDMIRKDKKGRWQERADAGLVGLAMRGKRFLGLGKKRPGAAAGGVTPAGLRF